jgi:hypothetical protein
MITMPAKADIDVKPCSNVDDSINKTNDKIEEKPFFASIDFNAYYDYRDFATFTVNIFSELPYGLSYFSFVDFYNEIKHKDIEDLTIFYTEQNLYWALSKKVPLDVTIQWAIASGESYEEIPSDYLRVGCQWRLSDTPVIEKIFHALNFSYSINFHLLNISATFDDYYEFQLEHIYRLDILPDILDQRIYLAGAIKHNIRPDCDDISVVITEHQLGIRIYDQLHIIAEFRYNGFWPEDKVGVGFGLQYILPFTYAN